MNPWGAFLTFVGILFVVIALKGNYQDILNIVKGIPPTVRTATGVPLSTGTAAVSTMTTHAPANQAEVFPTPSGKAPTQIGTKA